MSVQGLMQKAKSLQSELHRIGVIDMSGKRRACGAVFVATFLRMTQTHAQPPPPPSSVDAIKRRAHGVGDAS
jgi:hypothetical protein